MHPQPLMYQSLCISINSSTYAIISYDRYYPNYPMSSDSSRGVDTSLKSCHLPQVLACLGVQGVSVNETEKCPCTVSRHNKLHTSNTNTEFQVTGIFWLSYCSTVIHLTFAFYWAGSSSSYIIVLAPAVPVLFHVSIQWVGGCIANLGWVHSLHVQASVAEPEKGHKALHSCMISWSATGAAIMHGWGKTTSVTRGSSSDVGSVPYLHKALNGVLK